MYLKNTSLQSTKIKLNHAEEKINEFETLPEETFSHRGGKITNERNEQSKLIYILNWSQNGEA